MPIRLQGAVHHRTNVLQSPTKQPDGRRRLNGMHAPLPRILRSVVRTGVMVALAMLLILGLFPAILAAQAGRN